MDRKVFFDRIRRSLFRGSFSQSQVDGLNRLLAESARIGLQDAGQLAYILATAYHETGARMRPVREAHGDSDAQAIARLESAWRRGQLTWVKTPYWRRDADGKAWFGRGDVQLTHKANYVKMRPYVQDVFGVDIVADPDMVLRPDISALILFEGMLAGASGRGDFTGHRLETYVSGAKRDFAGARRVVNGTDRAAMIAGYAGHFYAAILAAGMPVAGDRPAEPSIPVDIYKPEPEPAPDPDLRPPPPGDGLGPGDDNEPPAGRASGVAVLLFTVLVAVAIGLKIFGVI